MRIIRNFLYVVCGYLKLIFIKIFHFSNMRFKGVSRIPASTRLSLSNNASIDIGRNFRVENNSIVSALKDGKLVIGDNVSLGGNNRVICHESIVIGSNTIMGPNVCIYDHDHIFTKEAGVDRSAYKSTPVEIGENCWIGANVVILRGTIIGNNCLIGAGSVVKGIYPVGSKLIQKREIELL